MLGLVLRNFHLRRGNRWVAKRRVAVEGEVNEGRQRQKGIEVIGKVHLYYTIRVDETLNSYFSKEKI